MIAEIYPLKIRGRAMGSGNCDELELEPARGAYVFELASRARHRLDLWLYALVGVAAWLFIYHRVPETKGKTLEEIEAQWRMRENPVQRRLVEGALSCRSLLGSARDLTAANLRVGLWRRFWRRDTSR